MCRNCVLEAPVITEQPVSTSDNKTLDNPQGPNEVPVKTFDMDANKNLNPSDSQSGLSDGTSQINLLTRDKTVDVEIHVETVA